MLVSEQPTPRVTENHDMIRNTIKKQYWYMRENVVNKRLAQIIRTVKLLCMILSWYIHVIIHSSKPIQCTTLRVTPNLNYGLCVIMTCQCRFTDYNKWTSLTENVPSAEGCACRGRGYIWELSIVVTQLFCSEPETAPKISLKKKKKTTTSSLVTDGPTKSIDNILKK